MKPWEKYGSQTVDAHTVSSGTKPWEKYAQQPAETLQAQAAKALNAEYKTMKPGKEKNNLREIIKGLSGSIITEAQQKPIEAEQQMQTEQLENVYSGLRGIESGLTLGASNVAAKYAEEGIAGERIEPSTTTGKILESGGALVGGIASGKMLGSSIASGLAARGITGLAANAATRIGTAAIQGAANAASNVIAGNKTAKEAAADVGQNVASTVLSMAAELAIPSGSKAMKVANAVGQVVTDLAADVGFGKLRGQDITSSDWWINELPQLATSAAFALRDATDTNFEATRKAQVQQLKDSFKASEPTPIKPTRTPAQQKAYDESLRQQREMETTSALPKREPVVLKSLADLPDVKPAQQEAEYAATQRKEPEISQGKYPQADVGRLPAGAGGGYRAPEGGKKPQEVAAPVAKPDIDKALSENVYVKMPIERVREDASKGVKLAQEALSLREPTEIASEAKTPVVEPTEAPVERKQVDAIQREVLKQSGIPDAKKADYVLDTVADGEALRKTSEAVAKGDMTVEQAAAKITSDFETKGEQNPAQAAEETTKSEQISSKPAAEPDDLSRLRQIAVDQAKASGVKPEDAEDLAQDVLVSFSKNYKPQEGKGPENYIRAATKRKAFTYKQKYYNEAQTKTSMQEDAGEGRTVEDTVKATTETPADDAVYSEVRQAVAKLPENQRRVVELRNEGYTYEEVGKELGLSRAQVTRLEKAGHNALRSSLTAEQAYRMNEAERRAKEQAGFVDPSGASSWVKKWFTAKGNMPEAAFSAKTKSDAAIRAHQQNANDSLRDLTSAIRKEYGLFKSPKDIYEQVDSVLKGDKPIDSLPESLRPHVKSMRDHVDAMSRKLVAQGVTGGPESAATQAVESGEGKYLNRSYRLFDDPGHAEKVLKEYPQLVTQVESIIAAEYPKLSPEEVRGKVEAMLYEHADSPISFIRSGKGNAKDISVLMKRSDIDPAIRALMGEYNDARVNYLRTISKQANLLERDKFLNEVKRQGLGAWLSETPSGQNVHRIASEGSKPMSPLNGLYTTKEIADAFRSGINVDDPSWVKAWIRASGGVKAASTVGSLITHVRNFIANPLLQVSQGYVGLGKAKQSIKAFAGHLGVERAGVISPQSAQKWRDQYNKYIRLGVVQEGANAYELRESIKRLSLSDDLDIQTSKSDLAKVAKSAYGAVETAYRMEDEVYKIYAFENERERYKKAMPYLSDAEVDEKAAQIVRNTQPTYSMTPKIVQEVRKFPLVGSFVSFPAEIIRTQFNTLKIAVDELGSNNTSVKAIGAQRLAGLISAHIIAVGTPLLSRMITGTRKDEEDDIRRFVAPWSENSQLAVLKADRDNGTYNYVDLSYSNPFTQIHKPIMAALKGDNLQESSIDYLKEFFSPFISEDILTSKLIDIRRNRTKEGKQIYNPQLPIGDRLVEQGKYIALSFVPGSYRSARRIQMASGNKIGDYGQQYDLDTELTALFTGQRREKLNVSQALSFKMRKYSNDLKESKGILSKVLTRGGKVTDQEIRDAYSKYSTVVERLSTKMADDISAARRLGVKENDIYAQVKDNAIPVQARGYILSGVVDAPTVSVPDRAKLMPGREDQINEVLSDYIEQNQRPTSFNTRMNTRLKL
jgi:RNA polymerase sigma factor (sigma-70 family)